MSKIGKQQIVIPEKVEVSIADTGSGALVSVKGPKGNLSRQFRPEVEVKIADKIVSVTPKSEDILARALWGTTAAHIKNMIKGVDSEFEKKLILEGIGFKSDVQGKNLNLALGFSHPVVVPIPDSLKVTAEKNIITITGVDKEAVGQFAAKVRALKEPEPYKGKGFHYHDEVVRRKQGKKSA
jgi:large subunit ribosomal protein L6